MSEAKFDAFLFYRSYREAINGMSTKDQLATLLAIIDYALYGIEPELKGKTPAAIFTVVRPNIDANNAKREAGKRGGRPKKETNGFQTVETNGSSKSESNEGQRESGADKPPTRPCFVPPTLEEVTAYVQERGSKVDPQGFIDFYASKGWMIGKTPMKDWKAAFRNAEAWERWDKKSDGRIKTAGEYESGDNFFKP